MKKIMDMTRKETNMKCGFVVILCMLVLSGCAGTGTQTADLKFKQETWLDKLKPSGWNNDIDKKQGGIQVTTVSQSTGVNDKTDYTLKDGNGNIVKTGTTAGGCVAGSCNAQTIQANGLKPGTYNLDVTGYSLGGTKTYQVDVKPNGWQAGTVKTYKVRSILN